jgi:CCR4-NOT transcription complex subunit 6
MPQWPPPFYAPTTTVSTTTPNPTTPTDTVAGTTDTFTTGTLNCLAFAYCNPLSHSGIPAAFLSDSHREVHLTAVLTALTASCDVILLQEVDRFADFYLPLITRLAWKQNSATRGSQELRDRVVTLYNPAVFRCVSEEVIDLDDLSRVSTPDDRSVSSKHGTTSHSKRYLRNNVGLLTLLLHKPSHNRVVIANAHLFWNPAFADVKLGQIAYVTARARDFADRNTPQSTPAGPSIIVAGDFNSLPGSSVHAFLSTGSSSLRATKQACLTPYPGFGSAPRYHCDASMNKFVRWVRQMGIDATLETPAEEQARLENGPEALFDFAVKQRRVLVTTSVRLMERRDCPAHSYFIDTKTTDSAETSFIAMLKAHGVVLRPKKFLSVCVKCGGNIGEITDEAAVAAARADDAVPPAANPLYRCDRCEQWYWWNDLPNSSAGRAKSSCVVLFQKCVKGGIAFDEIGGVVGEACCDLERHDSGDEGVSDDAVGSSVAQNTIQQIVHNRTLTNKCGALISAYDDDKYTNVTSNFKGCLDYIFFEGDRIEVVKRLELPSVEDLGGVLPSEYWPSDHLCLVASLRLKPSAEENSRAEATALQQARQAQHTAVGKCGCGCVPEIKSLFEMAEMRKALKEERAAAAAAAEDASSK